MLTETIAQLGNGCTEQSCSMQFLELLRCCCNHCWAI